MIPVELAMSTPSCTPSAPRARAGARTLLGLSLLALTACQPKVRYADSIDVKFDLRLSDRFDDRLSPPYVLGSSFTVYVYDRAERTDLNGWELRTNVPGVITIDDQFIDEEDINEDDNSNTRSDVIVADVFAAGEGSVVLEVYDDAGAYVRGIEVEVFQPDDFILRAAGPLFLRDEDRAPSEVDASPQVLSGGTATFEVEWYRDGQRLYGAGALEPTSESEGVSDLWSRRNVLSEDRDWMTLTATPAMGGTIAPVDIRANGEVIGTVEFELEDSETIDHLTLTGQSESGREDGDKVVVLAQALDADDETIWGTAFDWDLNGATEPGEGDLFRYKFERSKWSTLAASFDGQRVEMDIQGVEGVVDSSNNSFEDGCLCSAEDSKAPWEGTLALGLLVLAYAPLRRRRRGA